MQDTTMAKQHYSLMAVIQTPQLDPAHQVQASSDAHPVPFTMYFTPYIKQSIH